jgi:hypothetical protein
MAGETKSAGDHANSRRRPMRRFRWYAKKRGSRQTGSKRWGSAGEALFFAVLFLLGILALTELLVLRLVGNTQVFFASGWGLWLSVLILGSLIVIGAVGAIYSVILIGASAERRAALAKRATDIDLLADTQPSPKEYPNVPRETNWTNSPGIRLTYRLPIASSPAWRLLVVASFCLIWNGAVAVLAVLALNPTAPLSSISWMFVGMVLIYAILGGWSVIYLFRMLVAATAIGPTSVEVSAQPLFPGRRYQVFLTQAGHLKIDWLELRLVCDEEVSFSDGTDTRTETKRVHDQVIFRQEAFEIVPSEPFQHECPLDVPADGMHSFLSAHNAVIWKLVVRAASQKWPVFERMFPLVVYPACTNSA